MMWFYIGVTSRAFLCLPTALRTVIGFSEWKWTGAAYLDVSGDASER